MNYTILMYFQVTGLQVYGVITLQGYGDGDIGVIDNGLLGIHPDYWGYNYIG